MDATTFRLGYRPGLDAVRGVAVLAVVVAHAGVPLTYGGGAVGVTLFFVLSGFLITRLLVEELTDEHRLDLRAFYGRRVRRLLPALLGVVAVTSLWHLATEGIGHALRTATVVLAYIPNVARWAHHDLGLLNHTWSLGFEEQYYLLWPLILWAAARSGGRRAVAWAAATFVCAALGWRFVQQSEWSIYYGASRFDAIALGCLLACVPRWRPQRLTRMAAAIGLLVAVIARDLELLTLAPLLTLATICSAVVIAGVLDRTSAPAWLVRVGRLSYGLYLWHIPVWRSDVLGDAPWLLKTSVYGALSWGFTVASWRFIERRWRAPRRTGLPQDDAKAAPSDVRTGLAGAAGAFTPVPATGATPRA